MRLLIGFSSNLRFLIVIINTYANYKKLKEGGEI